jgi:hypothetical protein
MTGLRTAPDTTGRTFVATGSGSLSTSSSPRSRIASAFSWAACWTRAFTSALALSAATVSASS